MEHDAKKFARRILLIHLALLMGVAAIVLFASREVYLQTKDQATEQAKSHQALLASQTARGIEAFYHSIFSDLDLLRQADRDDDDETERPTTNPAPAPGLDWRKLLRLDERPNVINQNAAFQNFFTGILWKQLGGRVEILFAVNRDRLRGRDPERMLERFPIQTIGNAQNLLSEKEIVLKSIDWLKGIEKPQISRFQQYPLEGGKTIGLNLVCVPVSQRNPRLLVAAVDIHIAQDRFTANLNGDTDSTNAFLFDEFGTIMISSNEKLVGRNITTLRDDRLRDFASRYLAKGKRGTESIQTNYTLAGQEFPPGMMAIEPVSIAGKKREFLVTTPLSDVDAVVNRVFKRAIFWAIFVVGSMTAILFSTAVQLIRARVRMERVRNDLLTKELTQAREIQLAWLPQQGACFPAMDIAAVNHPASHISGDFYNWFELPDGRTVVTIGDVTGHGLSAAFLMATSQLLVHTTMLRLADPGKTLSEVNKQLCVQVFNGQFVTMLVCVIDMEAGTLEVATAGHYPPVLGTGGKFTSLPVEAQLVLGVEKDVRYPTERFELPPSASLVLYTDGVLDAQSPAGQRFDLERILESVQGHGESAQVLVDSIVGHITQFRGNRSLPDDLTLVCIATQTESSFRASEAMSV
jgi:serine phosphatase RsbU (regulator of sigma subunit)